MDRAAERNASQDGQRLMVAWDWFDPSSDGEYPDNLSARAWWAAMSRTGEGVPYSHAGAPLLGVRSGSFVQGVSAGVQVEILPGAEGSLSLMFGEWDRVSCVSSAEAPTYKLPALAGSS